MCLLFCMQRPLLAQEMVPEREQMHLQGKVKSLEEREYSAYEKTKPDGTREFFKDEETGIVSHQWTAFTRRGNVSEERIYDESGRVAAKTVYKYSETGDLMELHEYNEKGKKCGKTLFTYTSHRKYATQTVFLSDGSVEVATYYYDPKFPKLDLLDSVVWKTPTETRVEICLYCKHQSVGGCATPPGKPLASQLGPLLEKIWLVNGEMKKKVVYNNDNEGKFLSEYYEEIGKDKEERYSLSYTYDAQNRMTSVKRYDETKEWDDNSSLVKPFEYKIIWEYDDYGNVTSEKWYNCRNELTNATYYVYSYDDQHNWVKQMVFDEEQHVNTIVEREIAYY